MSRTRFVVSSRQRFGAGFDLSWLVGNAPLEKIEIIKILTPIFEVPRYRQAKYRLTAIAASHSTTFPQRHGPMAARRSLRTHPANQQLQTALLPLAPSIPPFLVSPVCSCPYAEIIAVIITWPSRNHAGQSQEPPASPSKKFPFSRIAASAFNSTNLQFPRPPASGSRFVTAGFASAVSHASAAESSRSFYLSFLGTRLLTASVIPSFV